MELVRQLQTGSRTAFDQIYERYHVQAYRTAVLLTGNRADAEDVVFLPKVMSRKKQIIPMLTALWG